MFLTRHHGSDHFPSTLEAEVGELSLQSQPRLPSENPSPLPLVGKKQSMAHWFRFLNKMNDSMLIIHTRKVFIMYLSLTEH